LLFGECEHEQVKKIDFLKNILLTHDIEYYMTWRNILPRVQGLKTKMDEKQMKGYNV